MSGWEIIWAGVSSTTIPEFVAGPVTRQLLGVTRNTFVDIPGLDGSWAFPEQRGRRQITIECFVMASSYPAGRRDAVTAVADWLDAAQGDQILLISDEPDVYYVGSLLDNPDVTEWRELGTFTLSFVCEPYSYDLNTSTRTITASASTSDVHDYGLLVPTYPVIDIQPTNGTITGFSLTVGGDTLTYSGLINSGNHLTINGIAEVVLDGVSGDVSLVGAYDPSNLAMAGVMGFFPRLVKGSNTIVWLVTGGTATAVTITITWRKRYRK